MSSPFREHIQHYVDQGVLKGPLLERVVGFYESFMAALPEGSDALQQAESAFEVFLDRVIRQVEDPYPFGSFHQKQREPIDYYGFGLDIFRPMVDFEKSVLLGKDNVATMQQQLARGENVILMANHQSELDPQVISYLTDSEFPGFAEEMVFVAGDRVLKDPIAVPFSLGRNLLCIYSKRHIDNPPEQKAEKQRHNQRTMQEMARLLSEGGVCIYIALSGGRDRVNNEGVLTVAPFDPAATEMLLLTARRAKTATHFYPLALWSREILPPPDTVVTELGEWRNPSYTPLGASFGNEVDTEHFPGHDLEDKVERRTARAKHFQSLVEKGYAELVKRLTIS